MKIETRFLFQTFDQLSHDVRHLASQTFFFYDSFVHSLGFHACVILEYTGNQIRELVNNINPEMYPQVFRELEDEVDNKI